MNQKFGKILTLGSILWNLGMERAMEPHPSTLICASHFMLAAGQIYSQHCRTLHDKTSMYRVVKNCKEQSQIVRSRVKFLYTASAVLFDANSLEFRNT